MYNFAGKCPNTEKKGPTGFDWATFWRTLDDNYFPAEENENLERKFKEIAGDFPRSQHENSSCI
jgi:hypothetical protein